MTDARFYKIMALIDWQRTEAAAYEAYLQHIVDGGIYSYRDFVKENIYGNGFELIWSTPEIAYHEIAKIYDMPEKLWNFVWLKINWQEKDFDV